MTTLFERLGGEGAIDAAVDLLYQKILSDGRINDFFRGVDMDTVRRGGRDGAPVSWLSPSANGNSREFLG